MVILYTAKSCSTVGEVNSTSSYCMHWSYSAGEWSVQKCSKEINVTAGQKKRLVRIMMR